MYLPWECGRLVRIARPACLKNYPRSARSQATGTRRTLDADETSAFPG